MKETVSQLSYLTLVRDIQHKKLQEAGFDADQAFLDFHEIILDLVGFPKDNSSKYEYDYSTETFRSKNGELDPEDFFCRDYLYDPFNELSDRFLEYKLTGGYGGPRFLGENKQIEVQDALNEYLAWLYNEYNAYCLSKLK